jgi:hypothetical protein
MVDHAQDEDQEICGQTLYADGWWQDKIQKDELAAHSYEEDNQAQEKPEKSRIPRCGSRVSDQEEAPSLRLRENLEETGYA